MKALAPPIATAVSKRDAYQSKLTGFGTTVTAFMGQVDKLAALIRRM